MRSADLVDPVTKQRPDPTIAGISVVEDSGRRSYEALQISAKKRLSHGMIADVFYTWSHSIVYAGIEDGGIQDNYNIAGSKGPANTDIRHLLILDFSYRLPLERLAHGALAQKLFGGWGIQGISRIASGSPITLLSGRDIRGDGTSSQRVNYLGGSQYASNQTIYQWFNKNAFALPVAGQMDPLPKLEKNPRWQAASSTER